MVVATTWLMGANKSANAHATHRVLTCQIFGGRTALGEVGATGTSPHKHRPSCGRDRPHAHDASRVGATDNKGAMRASAVSMSNEVLLVGVCSTFTGDWLDPISAIRRHNTGERSTREHAG